MSKHLPPHPNLKQLKIQAKDLRKAIQAADAESIQRLKAHLPRLADMPEADIRDAEVSLVDCQHVVAREYGFESWNWLRAVVEVDFGLLNRLGDRDVQILLREVDNPVLIIALQSADDDAGNTHPCPEGLVEKVLGLLPESLRLHIAERMALPPSVSLSQVLEARRRILEQVNLLAADGYVAWPHGNQSTPVAAPTEDFSPFLLRLVRRPVEDMSVDDIAELSARLTLQARRIGIVSLRALVRETVDPFLREALQLAVDGAGPNQVRDALESQIQPGRAALAKAQRLVIQGILSTQAGDNPGYVEQTIREAASKEVASRPSGEEESTTEVRREFSDVTEGDTEMDKELDFITDLLGQFLGKEDPTTVARIFSRLDTTLPAVLRRLPKAMHGEVVYQLFQLRVGEFGLLRWTVRDLGGVKKVAEILNYSGASTEKKVLDFLDPHDPHLAEEVRNQMFTFEDIARVPDQDIQQLLRAVDGNDMAMALRGVGEKVRERFLSNMSDSDPLDLSAAAKTRVQEAMASSGPVRVLDVEDAQIRIVQQMRQLEEQGRVAIARGEGDYIL